MSHLVVPKVQKAVCSYTLAGATDILRFFNDGLDSLSVAEALAPVPRCARCAVVRDEILVLPGVVEQMIKYGCPPKRAETN